MQKRENYYPFSVGYFCFMFVFFAATHTHTNTHTLAHSLTHSHCHCHTRSVHEIGKLSPFCVMLHTTRRHNCASALVWARAFRLVSLGEGDVCRLGLFVVIFVSVF